MILIAVVDDNMGLCFNHRRLSRDKILSEKIMELTDGKVVWMSSYSAKMFGVNSKRCKISPDQCRR